MCLPVGYNGNLVTEIGLGNITLLVFAILSLIFGQKSQSQRRAGLLAFLCLSRFWLIDTCARVNFVGLERMVNLLIQEQMTQKHQLAS